MLFKGLSVTSSIRCIAASVQRLDDFQTILIIFSFLLYFLLFEMMIVLESARSVLYVFEKPSIKMLSNVFFFFFFPHPSYVEYTKMLLNTN